MIGRRSAWLLLLVAAAACERGKSAVQRALPAGDAVWLSAGLSGGEAEAEEIFSHRAFARVFLPALQLSVKGGAVRSETLPPPPRPVAAVPVVLVVTAEPDFQEALAAGSEALTAPVADGVQKMLAGRTGFGRVEGIHLDLPFSPATAEGFGRLAEALRARVPADLFLTASLRFTPTEKEREAFVKQLAALDGFAAFVFEDGARADAVAADGLGKPWWAAYLAGARGRWRNAAGDPRGTLPEKFLRSLTDDPRSTMAHDLGLQDEGVSGFIFRATAPIEIDGVTLDAGDEVAFRQPAVSELLYRFGADLTGRRLVKGRLVVLDGASESERIFTLAALSDVLLGRPLLPDLRVAVTSEPLRVRVEAENRSTHASAVSRTTNWVEVDVPSNHIGDVQLGGFDRYEVFDADGRPVTPGRATRVRFYELLLAPGERIAPAAILLRSGPPPGCCRFRSHVLAASGTELGGDWASPPVPPTPTPSPTKARGKPKSRRR